jgi:hypothetical protein
MGEEPARVDRRLGAPIRLWQKVVGVVVGFSAVIIPYLLVRPHLPKARSWVPTHLTESTQVTQEEKP